MPSTTGGSPGFFDKRGKLVERDFLTVASAGDITSHSSRTLFGFLEGLLIAETPSTIWVPKTLHSFLTAESAWEIVSTSASDTAAGTGARTVLIVTLDANYVEQTNIVTMNGTTPVALPGLHMRFQSALVITSGSGNTNAGTIDVRVASAGAVQARMRIGDSIVFPGFFTVPAGFSWTISNFLFQPNKAGGSDAAAKIAPFFKLNSGVIAAGLPATYRTGTTAYVVPASVTVPEKTTFGFKVTSISADTVDISVGVTGVLAPI